MKKLIAVEILSMLTTSISSATTNYFYQPFDTNYMMTQDIRKVTSVKNYTMNLDSNKIKIPAGVEIKARLQTISDESKLVYGQNVTAILEEEFNYKDSLILPIGTILEGNVIKKHEKSSEILTIRFNQIKTLSNEIIPINGVLKSNISGNIVVELTQPVYINKF